MKRKVNRALLVVNWKLFIGRVAPETSKCAVVFNFINEKQNDRLA